MGFLLSELRTNLQYTGKCSFIYTRKKGTVFPALMFRKSPCSTGMCAGIITANVAQTGQHVDSLVRRSFNARQ
jgi:hypothetical protein